MQMAAPELTDLSKEPESLRKLYGLDDEQTSKFGRICLHKILEPRGIAKLVTDAGIGEATRAELTHIGVEVIIA